MIRAVLDTNVLVSALISPFGNEARALDAVLKGRITPCLSTGVLREYAEVLARPKFSFSSEQIDGLLGLLQAKGVLFEPLPAPGASPDPGDDDLIACALEANADFLVTGNKRHFPAEAYGQARVVSAKELLEALGQVQT